jgi:hypothetical protein
MLEELAAVTVPSFLNAGFKVGSWRHPSVKGVSSLIDHHLAFAALGGDRA